MPQTTAEQVAAQGLHDHGGGGDDDIKHKTQNDLGDDPAEGVADGQPHPVEGGQGAGKEKTQQQARRRGGQPARLGRVQRPQGPEGHESEKHGEDQTELSFLFKLCFLFIGHTARTRAGGDAAMHPGKMVFQVEKAREF